MAAAWIINQSKPDRDTVGKRKSAGGGDTEYRVPKVRIPPLSPLPPIAIFAGGNGFTQKAQRRMRAPGDTA